MLSTPSVSAITSVLGNNPETIPSMSAQEVDSNIYLTALYLFRASQLLSPIDEKLSSNILNTSNSLLEVIEKEPVAFEVLINEEEINFIKETIKDAL